MPLTPLQKKYKSVIKAASHVNLQGTITEEDGTLVIAGTLFTVPERDRLLAAIHNLPGWETDLRVNLHVSDEGVAAWAKVEHAAGGDAK
jgi:hypothetical protein